MSVFVVPIFVCNPFPSSNTHRSYVPDAGLDVFTILGEIQKKQLNHYSLYPTAVTVGVQSLGGVVTWNLGISQNLGTLEPAVGLQHWVN